MQVLFSYFFEKLVLNQINNYLMVLMVNFSSFLNVKKYLTFNTLKFSKKLIIVTCFECF